MTDISNAAAALGKKGGSSRSPRKIYAVRQNLKKAVASLTAEERRERAKKAAAARWSKQKAAGKDAQKLDVSMEKILVL